MGEPAKAHKTAADHGRSPRGPYAACPRGVITARTLSFLTHGKNRVPNPAFRAGPIAKLPGPLPWIPPPWICQNLRRLPPKFSHNSMIWRCLTQNYGSFASLLMQNNLWVYTFSQSLAALIRHTEGCDGPDFGSIFCTTAVGDGNIRTREQLQRAGRDDGTRVSGHAWEWDA